ncbi:hypothetical protein Lgee_2006 [Legionella geestiana]|uniref:Uncharacterized protein n=1 Tax=Legionella geestiana TaxID=45065 RepID=A0A0W0TP21_9GAMM|nr:hypothetical protein [Legionella geestiana]KTC97345.1 hypothetical protein Lgee_2006 [Legionella geestiana]QBS12469.1 hypothetical protein E4T54_06745 [Legionella geestiana]QDQ39816.1 hypothetical protein E3226_005115 [Legionella geestiana]STX55087.1 Uncharacterised protein [Legionella geestiana]
MKRVLCSVFLAASVGALSGCGAVETVYVDPPEYVYTTGYYGYTPYYPAYWGNYYYSRYGNGYYWTSYRGYYDTW